MWRARRRSWNQCECFLTFACLCWLDISQTSTTKKERSVKYSTPIQYEAIKNIFQQNSVSSYDGFRFIVQKQVNLNTVVSHFYWLGSQQTQQPIYQYRVILPFDERVINVATDMDFNIEGEIKGPISRNLNLKTNFNVSLCIDLEFWSNIVLDWWPSKCFFCWFATYWWWFCYSNRIHPWKWAFYYYCQNASSLFIFIVWWYG